MSMAINKIIDQQNNITVSIDIFISRNNFKIMKSSLIWCNEINLLKA